MKYSGVKCVILGVLSMLATELIAQEKDTRGAASDPKEAASIAKRQQPGKVLSVKRDDGYYKVKILHEGKVNYIVVKAQ